MITMPERIATLRSEKGLSKKELSTQLGFSPNAIDQFESGRQTPSKDKQTTIANFFGVSLAYLRGETNDPTRQDSWMDMTYSAEEEPRRTVELSQSSSKATSTKDTGGLNLETPMFLAMLKNPENKAALQTLILDTLRTPEGKALIKHIMDENK